MQPTDQELVHQVRAQDADAFEALCDRYREQLRRHLLRIVRDPDATEDLLQEVLLRVWMHGDRWDERGSFKAWLFRVATNLALNHLRTVRRRRQRPLDLPPDAVDDEGELPAPSWIVDASSLGPEALLEQAEQHALLRRLIGQLSDEKREVFRLVYDAEMEMRAVAEHLGVPEGTVKSRLHYATKRIAREWKELSTEWEEL